MAGCRDARLAAPSRTFAGAGSGPELALRTTRLLGQGESCTCSRSPREGALALPRQLSADAKRPPVSSAGGIPTRSGHSDVEWASHLACGAHSPSESCLQLARKANLPFERGLQLRARGHGRGAREGPNSQLAWRLGVSAVPETLRPRWVYRAILPPAFLEGPMCYTAPLQNFWQ